jgi:hypothetical protein
VLPAHAEIKASLIDHTLPYKKGLKSANVNFYEKMIVYLATIKPKRGNTKN